MILRRFRWGLGVIPFALAATLGTSDALAQSVAASLPPRQTEAFEYDAPAQCPDRDNWAHQVSERLEGGMVGAARLDDLLVRVGVAPSGQEARILFRGAGGAERLITGRDCEEILSAAALIAAMAIASASSTAPATPPHADRPAPVPLESSRQVLGGPAPAPARSVARFDPPPSATAAISDPPGVQSATNLPMLEPAPTPQLASIDLDVALGGGAGVNVWLGPQPLGSFDVFVDLLPHTHAWSLRVALSSDRARAEVEGRSADFSLWGGNLAFCPLILGARWGWQWSSCAEARLGVLRASGNEASRLAAGVERTFAWGGTGAITRLQTPALSGVRIEVEAGAVVPFWHREFRFDEPDAQVFETPALGAMARVGLQVPLETVRSTD